MDAVLRAFVIYGFLLVLFRILGKRSLGQVTTFDFVLLLVIGEATQQALLGEDFQQALLGEDFQQALLGEDFSMTNAMIVIGTLVGIDIGLSVWKQRSPQVDKLIEG